MLYDYNPGKSGVAIYRKRSLLRERVMNASSKEKVLEKYDYVGPFSEGLAVAVKEGSWFHIKEDKTPAYKERYDFTYSFSEGLAWVQKGGRQFRIRPDGTKAV